MTLYVASAVLVLDRITKVIALRALIHGQCVKIFPNVFHLALVLNKGAAFGLFKDQKIFFIMLSLFVTAFIILYTLKRKTEDRFLRLALGLILGGAIGNLIDRLWFGYVIDFLDFRVWPVFNVADSCITIGTMVLVFKVFFRKPCIRS